MRGSGGSQAGLPHLDPDLEPGLCGSDALQPGCGWTGSLNWSGSGRSGGEMGLNTDYTSIQMRLLNTGKGPAVHALRAQSDKMSYQNRMKQTLENSRTGFKTGSVDKILVKGKVCGVVTSTGARFEAGAVILTTGTYLKGRIIIGDLSYPGRPMANSLRFVFQIVLKIWVLN